MKQLKIKQGLTDENPTENITD